MMMDDYDDDDDVHDYDDECFVLAWVTLDPETIPGTLGVVQKHTLDIIPSHWTLYSYSFII